MRKCAISSPRSKLTWDGLVGFPVDAMKEFVVPEDRSGFLEAKEIKFASKLAFLAAVALISDPGVAPMTHQVWW